MNRQFKPILGMLIFAAGLNFSISSTANAHCQIPCGIYDDHLRVELMMEDVTTIYKALSEIDELSNKKDAQSQNQMVRWVINKENHAQKIIETISNYFLTQRVKPSQKDYSERLEKHHLVIMLAMKAKQNTDISHAEALRKAVADLSPYYPAHEHGKK